MSFDKQRIKGPNNRRCILIRFTTYLGITRGSAVLLFPPHFALSGLVCEFNTDHCWCLFISFLSGRALTHHSTTTNVSLSLASRYFKALLLELPGGVIQDPGGKCQCRLQIHSGTRHYLYVSAKGPEHIFFFCIKQQYMYLKGELMAALTPITLWQNVCANNSSFCAILPPRIIKSLMGLIAGPF